MRQRGFSLVELVIIVAIVIAVATFAFAAGLGHNAIATRSALTQLDAALAYGKGLAATSGNGATLLFVPKHPGVAIEMYAGRPNAPYALRAAGIAPFVVNADIAENSIGSPPFAVFLNSAGYASAAPFSGATPAPLAAEPACPARGRWVLTVTRAVGAASVAQSSPSLPCRPTP